MKKTWLQQCVCVLTVFLTLSVASARIEGDCSAVGQGGRPAKTKRWMQASKVAEGVKMAEEALQQPDLSDQGVWNQEFLASNPALKDILTKFAEGRYANSLSALSLWGRNLGDVQKQLQDRGFQPWTSPVAKGHKKLKQMIYVHPDGGMVRIKTRRWDQTLQAVKAVMYDPDKGGAYDNEAFKVSEKGRSIPRRSHGRYGMRLPHQHKDVLYGWMDRLMEEAHILIENSSISKPEVAEKK